MRRSHSEFVSLSHDKVLRHWLCGSHGPRGPWIRKWGVLGKICRRQIAWGQRQARADYVIAYRQVAVIQRIG